MERKKIIVMGATGNTGSYLVEYALSFFDQEKFEIVASGRRKTNFFDKYGVKYYSVDVTRPEEFDALPQENVHAVLLLSAQIPSYMDQYEPKKYIDSIVLGAFNTLEYCRKTKVDRILFTQTVFDVSLYPEGTLLTPNIEPRFSYRGDHAVYVIAKNAALELIEHYHQEYGLKKFIFRLPTIYSYSPYPYYYPNGKKTKRPVYTMIERAMNSEPLEIWGNPNYSKDMVHVYDFSQMLCKAVLVDRNQGFYNIGTGIPVTLEEQIRTIIQVFSPKENPSEVVYRPDLKSGGGFLMDVSNAKEELGYEPQYDCLKLFESYKEEMAKNRFAELRLVEEKK